MSVPGKIIIINNTEKCPDGFVDINTTSRSTSWTRGLSPFVVGPCDCALLNSRSWNVENSWQFSKVYECHDDNGRPNADWFMWAMRGFADKKAHRYPMGIKMGKKKTPLYSWYQREKYGYIEARKAIYIPLYARAVAKTPAYGHLKAMHEIGIDLALRDFDGYRIDSLNVTFDDVVNNPGAALGHSFVIAMMLEGYINKYVENLIC
jgi:hypothetical protein